MLCMSPPLLRYGVIHVQNNVWLVISDLLIIMEEKANDINV